MKRAIVVFLLCAAIAAVANTSVDIGTQRIDFTGLSGSQNTTTLFVPGETAIYRVTIVADTQNTVSIQMFNSQLNVPINIPPGVQGLTNVFRASANDTVSFSTTATGTYNLHFVVEKL